jgi:hypothetical protein
LRDSHAYWVTITHGNLRLWRRSPVKERSRRGLSKPANQTSGSAFIDRHSARVWTTIAGSPDSVCRPIRLHRRVRVAVQVLHDTFSSLVDSLVGLSPLLGERSFSCRCRSAASARCGASLPGIVPRNILQFSCLRISERGFMKKRDVPDGLRVSFVSCYTSVSCATHIGAIP